MFLIVLFVSACSLNGISPVSEIFKINAKNIENVDSIMTKYVTSGCTNSSAKGSLSITGNEPKTDNVVSVSFLNLKNLSGSNTLKKYSSSSCEPWGALFINSTLYNFPSGTVLDLSNGNFSVAKTVVESYDGDELEVTLKGKIQIPLSKVEDKTIQVQFEKVEIQNKSH